MQLKIQTPPWLEDFLKPARYKGAYGGRGCVHPDTVLDTPYGGVKIKDWTGGYINSFDINTGKPCVAYASPAYEYDEQDLYEVVLDNNYKITVTDEHKFYNPESSTWVMLKDLNVGDVVATSSFFSCETNPILTSLPQTNLGTSLSRLLADVLRLKKIHEDYLGDCLIYRHQCGRLPRSLLVAYPTFLPLQDDEQPHNSHVWFHLGDQVNACIDTLSSTLTHACNRSSPPFLEGKSCSGLENYTSCKSFELLLGSNQLFQLSHMCRNLLLHSAELDAPSLVCDILLSLGRILEKVDELLHSSLFDNPFVSSDLIKFDITKHYITGITMVNPLKYWDLHVYGTNCYFAQGFLNHNSGKSHAFAELLIEQMLLNPNAKWVCIREVQKSLNQSVKALLEHKIEAMGASHYFEVQQAMIKNKHGSGMIIFQGMQNHTADSIKSLEGYDGAWVEEAQSLSQRSLDLLRPTIRKEGSELWFTWNPRYEKDPIDLFLRGGNPPSGSVIKRINWSDNPWFPDVLRDEMEYDRRRDPEKFAHVWEGEYESLSEARVFKNWKVDEFESPRDAMFKFGADWGFAKDPTVLVRGWFEGRTLYIDYEAYEVGCEIDKTPDLFLTIPESEVFTIVADSARPETISYMQKHGFPNIRKALKGKNSIIEGINFLKSFDIIVHPRCTHVIDELTLYSYKVDPLTEEVMPVLKDEHNHTIDAIRYLAEASRRAHKAIKALDVRPIPSINKWNGRKYR